MDVGRWFVRKRMRSEDRLALTVRPVLPAFALAAALLVGLVLIIAGTSVGILLVLAVLFVSPYLPRITVLMDAGDNRFATWSGRRLTDLHAEPTMSCALSDITAVEITPRRAGDRAVRTELVLADGTRAAVEPGYSLAGKHRALSAAIEQFLAESRSSAGAAGPP